jgi:hypothetical protein
LETKEAADFFTAGWGKRLQNVAFAYLNSSNIKISMALVQLKLLNFELHWSHNSYLQLSNN